jgi:hypothetical protein
MVDEVAELLQLMAEGTTNIPGKYYPAAERAVALELLEVQGTPQLDDHGNVSFFQAQLTDAGFTVAQTLR